ncbi:MAG TPA: SDR family oxidoreductase [Ramlibacter sp.]|jgi:NAD(P)-dependent dehydrogenase (short-subunit alcohol dehydrogenase family)
MSNDAMRAVVSGTSSGIGRAIALELLANGWHVEGLDIAAPSVHATGFAHRAVDLADGSAVDSIARECRGARAFVHAAGVLRTARAGELDPARGEAMWRLHVDAASRIANELLPAMVRSKSGRVVLIGSRVSRGSPGRSQYAATKAALVALARSWAMEVASSGVTVNVVSPAATRTAMLDDPARRSVVPQLPPLGRLIEPKEVASLVAYLLSPAAAPITGQEINVCGGASLGH